MMYTKKCVVCTKGFLTGFLTRLHCSLDCINTKQRNRQREKAKKLRELETENKRLNNKIDVLEGTKAKK